jgi:hypothetical protein
LTSVCIAVLAERNSQISAFLLSKLEWWMILVRLWFTAALVRHHENLTSGNCFKYPITSQKAHSQNSANWRDDMSVHWKWWVTG